MFAKWQLWVFAILAVLPLVWWRQWMTAYPEGIPVNDWLLNGGNIRFKGSFFYWIFADRLGRLILGYWGMALFIIGLLVNSNSHHLKKHGYFFYSFIIASLLYVTVFARGNVQHDYYQILIIPSLVIFMGMGARALLKPPQEFINPLVSRLVLFVCIGFSFLFGWYFIRDYFNINNRSIIIAGEAVDKLTPKTAKVIALYDGDTTFLYYTKRKGWTSFEKSLPEMVQLGADYLVIANPTERDYGLATNYTVVASQKEYLLIRLDNKSNKVISN
jgi:hypothetical protein